MHDNKILANIENAISFFLLLCKMVQIRCRAACLTSESYIKNECQIFQGIPSSVDIALEISDERFLSKRLYVPIFLFSHAARMTYVCVYYSFILKMEDKDNFHEDL